MATLGEFARRNAKKRACLPALVQLDGMEKTGGGLDWILTEMSSFLDCRILKLKCSPSSTTIIIREEAS